MKSDIYLPKRPEAEKTVLGAAMGDERSAILAVSSLQEDDFQEQANKYVFRAVKALSEAKKPVNAVTVTDLMRDMHILDDAGGADYLMELVDSVISFDADQTAFFVGEIRKASQERNYLVTIHDVIRRYKEDMSADPLSFIAETKAKIDEAASKGSAVGFVGSREVSETMVAWIEKEKQSGKKGLTGLDTGYSAINEMTHGWHPGDYIVVAGRPSMGKSAFAANVAWAASKAGCPVAFFSFEMTSVQIMQRMVSAVSMVDGDRIKSGMVTDAEFDRVKKAAAEIAEKEIYFDDASTGVLAEVMADANRSKIAHPNLGLVVVDYIGLMRTNQRMESRRVEIATISRAFKQMARSLNVPVLVLCQLNRETEDNEGSRPTMANLSESGAMEQDPDVVILLHRPSYYESRKQGKPEPTISVAEAIVAKNRNGRTGTVNLTFDTAHSRFDNCSKPNLAEKIPLEGGEEE